MSLRIMLSARRARLGPLFYLVLRSVKPPSGFGYVRRGRRQRRGAERGPSEFHRKTRNCPDLCGPLTAWISAGATLFGDNLRTTL